MSDDRTNPNPVHPMPREYAAWFDHAVEHFRNASGLLPANMATRDAIRAMMPGLPPGAVPAPTPEFERWALAATVLLVADALHAGREPDIRWLAGEFERRGTPIPRGMVAEIVAGQTAAQQFMVKITGLCVGVPVPESDARQLYRVLCQRHATSINEAIELTGLTASEVILALDKLEAAGLAERWPRVEGQPDRWWARAPEADSRKPYSDD